MKMSGFPLTVNLQNNENRETKLTEFENII